MADLSYKNDEDTDARLDPAELHAQEQKAAFDNEFNPGRMAEDGKSGDLSGGPSLNEQEENATPPSWSTNITPGGQTKKTKFLTKQTAKKLSPLAGLLVTIAAAIIGVSITAPALILEEIKSVFSTDLNKSNPALNIRARAVLKFKADGVKNGFAETSEGVCGVACKLGTVSDAFIAKMKASGFDVNVTDTKIPGRSVVSSIVFPADSQGNRYTAHTGDEFITAMDEDPLKAAAFAKVINLGTIFLLNANFKTLLTKLGLNKAAQTSGDTEEAVDKSEDAELTGEGSGETDVGDLSTEEASDLTTASASVGAVRAAPLIDSASFKTVNEKLSGKSNLVGAVCTGYDVIKGITLTDELAKQGAFIAFAWTFLNAADQQMYGDGTQAQATALGTQLTSSDTNKTTTDSNGKTIPNPYYGETATDSAGYREAADLDNPGTLSEPQQRFSLSPLGAIGLLSLVTNFLVQKPGSVQTTALTAACNPATQAAVTVGGCLADAGAASVIPGIGTAAAAGLCAAGNLAAPQVVGSLLSPVIESFIKTVAEYDLPKIASTTIGGEAGDAIFAGSASLFNLTGESYGMSAATSAAQVAQFAVDTNSIMNQEADIARVQARSTPFDIYNQYSFLGSIAQSINLSSFSSSSIGSSLGALVSIIPSSFATLFSPAGAAATPETDAQKEAALYSAPCQNPSVAASGAVCDSYGLTTDYMDSAQLGMDLGSNLNYMFNNGYVDPTTGAPSGDYSQWLQNCQSRPAQYGETSGSIVDLNYNWEVGAYCLDGASGPGAPSTNELDNFGVYYMDNAAGDTYDAI